MSLPSIAVRMNQRRIIESMPKLEDLGVLNNTLFIKLDGHKYGYTSINGKISDIYNSFKGILKHSPVKALAWLKKNAKLVSGSVKGSSQLYTKDNPRYIAETSTATKTVKDIKIVDGKKAVVISKEYIESCKEGYKRDPETGKCIRMSLVERRDRSIAATKAANNPTTKKNKATSMRRRDALIKD